VRQFLLLRVVVLPRLVVLRRLLVRGFAGFLPVSASSRIFAIVEAAGLRLRRLEVVRRVEVRFLRRLVVRLRVRVVAPCAIPSI
jgi:hypothetical protein